MHLKPRFKYQTLITQIHLISITFQLFYALTHYLYQSYDRTLLLPISDQLTEPVTMLHAWNLDDCNQYLKSEDTGDEIPMYVFGQKVVGDGRQVTPSAHHQSVCSVFSRVCHYRRLPAYTRVPHRED